MTYHDQLEQQAATVADQVLAALALYEAGQLTADALIGVVAAYIAAGNNAATALADVALAAAVTVHTGTPAAPLGLTRPLDDSDRLARAATTLLDTPDASPARWQRLADAEIKEAGSRAYSTAVTAQPAVTGWTRGLSADACQLCRWWARNGRLWPPDHPMPTHKGCTCSQIITTRKEAA